VVAGLRFRAEQYCQSSPAQSSSATADFGFSYVSAYGTNGLSQPYAGPTATGQSYGTGVAVDSSQKAYTLVQANADVGCGWLPGLLPGQQRHDRAQLYQPQLPGAVLHRAAHHQRRHRHGIRCQGLRQNL